MTHPNEEDKSSLVRERTTEGCAQTKTPRTDALVQRIWDVEPGNFQQLVSEMLTEYKEMETELRQARAEAQRLLGVDAKLKEALLEVERLKRDVAKAVEDSRSHYGDCNIRGYVLVSNLQRLGITHDLLTNAQQENLTDEQPVNSSPEREPVANREQGGRSDEY